MSDTDTGKKIIRYWFEKSNLKSQGKTVNDAWNYYADTSRKTNRVSPSFIVNVGGAARLSNLSDSRLRDAMESLAATNPNGWPSQTSFFDALAGERLSFRYEDAVDVAKGTLSDIKSAAGFGLSIYVVVLGIGSLIFLYPLLSRRRA